VKNIAVMSVVMQPMTTSGIYAQAGVTQSMISRGGFVDDPYAPNTQVFAMPAKSDPPTWNPYGTPGAVTYAAPAATVSMAAPAVQYAAPPAATVTVAETAPAVTYAAPMTSYAAPTVTETAPAVTYAAPMTSYAAPTVTETAAASYVAPAATYAAPMTSYAAPAPTMTLPTAPSMVAYPPAGNFTFTPAPTANVVTAPVVTEPAKKTRAASVKTAKKKKKGSCC